MRKFFVFSMLALLGMTQAAAQDYEYVPFVREGVKWVYKITNLEYYMGQFTDPDLWGKIVYRILEFKGDTIINGKTYKAMHKYSGSSINEVNDTIPIYMREENKIVYGIIPDGRIYIDCPIGNGFTPNLYDEGNEFVLYDFQDPVAYWNGVNEFVQNDFPGLTLFNHLYTDEISIGDHKAKRYAFNYFDERDWYVIEGIGFDDMGSSFTLSFFIPTFGGAYGMFFALSHVVEDGRIIYKGIHYDPDNMTGIDEVVADKGQRAYDGTYYNLMGQPVGKEVPTTPGIYIHNGNKIIVR